MVLVMRVWPICWPICCVLDFYSTSFFTLQLLSPHENRIKLPRKTVQKLFPNFRGALFENFVSFATRRMFILLLSPPIWIFVWHKYVLSPNRSEPIVITAWCYLFEVFFLTAPGSLDFKIPVFPAITVRQNGTKFLLVNFGNSGPHRYFTKLIL